MEDTVANKVLIEWLTEYNSDGYAARYMWRRKWLRDAFRNYHLSSIEEQGYLKRLVEIHTKECRSRGNTECRRRHNTFVLVYIAERRYTAKEIAAIQGITQRAVWKDVNHVLDDMMLLAFGVDGIKATGKGM